MRIRVITDRRAVPSRAAGSRSVASSRRVVLGSLLGLALFVAAPAVASAEVPEAPVTEAPAAVTGTTATLKGELNPGVSVERVSYRFFYAPGGECTASIMAPSEPPFPEAEGNHQKVSLPVTGLEASTTYSVCLFAANPAEEAEQVFGSSVEFTTPASAPVVVSQTATGVSPFAATLTAEVNPENESTTSCSFEYGKGSVGENTLPCEQLELNGAGVGTVTRALAGLSPGTTYHFRVLVANATGETEGTEQTFETLAAETPSITSESATGITPFQARLEGALNPNFQPTKCSFSWGLVVGENKAPCEPELFEGFGEQGFGATITGLTPATTYHYQVQARNAAGESEGAEQEFTTLPLEAPIFASENPTGVTSTDAQLEARINPDAQETTVSFEFASEQSVLEEEAGTIVAAGSLPAVFEEVTAGPVDLGGSLTPGATYFYRVIAKNETGETKGPIQEFTTSPPEPPIIGSETVTGVTETGATFEANINPNGHEATYEFQYATDEGFTENVGSVEGKEPLPAVSEELPTEALQATGLNPGTVYFYRVVATNPIMGTTDGPTQSFRTLAKPAVTTNPATEVTRTSASITGTVNPGGAPTTYKVFYVTEAVGKCPNGVGCDYAKGNATTSRTFPATGYTAEPAGPVALEELTPGTTYHYTIAATNSTGTTVGPDRTFKTSAPTPPTATIGAASSIGQTTATISGTVNTEGLPTAVHFQIGTEPTNTTQLAAATSQSGNTIQATAAVGGLQPGTTYYYSVTATSSDGTTESAQASFTTATVPITITLPTTLPLLSFTPITAIGSKEAEENSRSSHVKPSRAELLAKALKACHKKPKHKRAACERAAHKKYGRAKKKG